MGGGAACRQWGVTVSKPPGGLIDSILDREGRTCPKCKRPHAVTTRDVEGDGDWEMGKLWCPKCGWTMNVCVDGDGAGGGGEGKEV